jgi:hypothetical protein
LHRALSSSEIANMKFLTSIRVYRDAALRKLRRACGLPTDPYPARPEGTYLSPSLGLIAATDAMPRRYALDPSDIEGWQTRARARLADLTGYVAATAPPTIVDVRGPVPLPQSPDIEKTTYYLRVRPQSDLPVTVLTSTVANGPRPVFLYLAGSTSGVHLGWGETKVPIDHQRLSIGADIALQAARRGYLAVCIEQTGYGEKEERDLLKRSSNRTIDIAVHAALLGQSLLGLKAMDVSATIDWLASPAFPHHIDPARIFLFGHSSGGTAAQFAAALDTRILGTLASGSVRRLTEVVATRGNGNGELLIPRFLQDFESDDVLALIAPRPFVGLSGIDDHIFPFDGVTRAIEGALPAYRSFDAADKIKAVAAPFGHRYYAEESWNVWRQIIDPNCGDDPKAR